MPLIFTFPSIRNVDEQQEENVEAYKPIINVFK